MRRRILMSAGLAVPLAALGRAGMASAAQRRALPEVIDLPPGSQPEGIVVGPGPMFYVGSLADGTIYRGDLRTGRVRTLVAGRAGGQAVGLEFDHRGRLWVAGGGTGGAIVYDRVSGARLAEYSFGGLFVNDAVATWDTVYFTDSNRPFLYAVPLGPGGRLPAQEQVRAIELTGGLAEEGAFNNGIEVAWDGRLIIVQMLAGRLYAYNPRSGRSAQVDTGGASVLNGDGLLLCGPILYVVRNSDNLVAKFRLSGDLSRATLIEEITDPDLDVPATIGGFGPYLYAVNGRFNVGQPTPETPYAVVRLPA